MSGKQSLKQEIVRDKMSKAGCSVFKVRTQVGTILDFIQQGRNTRVCFRPAQGSRGNGFDMGENRSGKRKLKMSLWCLVQVDARMWIHGMLQKNTERETRLRGMVMRSFCACWVGGCLVDIAGSWISEERDLSYK